MPRPAHRRCKTQGPTCNGVAHPHFDTCNRCLNDVIRPRLRAEKEAMRKRRADRLSRRNRELINETDLKEPQMREEHPLSVREAIRDISINNRLAPLVEKHEQEGLPFQDAVDAAASELILKSDMRRFTDIPIEIYGPMPENFGLAPDPNAARAALDGPPPEMPNSRTRPDGTRLTAEQRTEAAEAYRAGMPVEEICGAWGISLSTLYRTLGVLGISRRGQPTAHQPKEKPVTVPTSSTPESHVPRETPPVNGTAPGLTEWLVTYQVTRTETVVVAAKDFNSAAQAVETDGSTSTVISVARKV